MTTKLTAWEIEALRTAMREAIINHPDMIERRGAERLLATLDNAKSIEVHQYVSIDIFA